MAAEVTSPVPGSIKPTFLTYFSSLRSGGAMPSVCLVLVALFVQDCSAAGGQGISAAKVSRRRKPNMEMQKARGTKNFSC